MCNPGLMTATAGQLMAARGGKQTLGVASIRLLREMLRMQVVNFRANIIDWLSVLAADVDEQLRAVGGLPEELRLSWESCFLAVDERNPNSNGEGLAQFTPSERAALVEFDSYMWSLPAEPDPMWHRDALDEEPWPQVRAKAAGVLNRLQRPG